MPPLTSRTKCQEKGTQATICFVQLIFFLSFYFRLRSHCFETNNRKQLPGNEFRSRSRSWLRPCCSSRSRSKWMSLSMLLLLLMLSMLLLLLLLLLMLLLMLLLQLKFWWLEVWKVINQVAEIPTSFLKTMSSIPSGFSFNWNCRCCWCRCCCWCCCCYK